MAFELSKQHIKVLLEATPEDVTIEDWLPEVIANIQAIRKQLDTFAKMKQKFEAELDILEEDKQRLQEDCPHWFSVYQGDPSGGSDSYSYCEICGADL